MVYRFTPGRRSHRKSRDGCTQCKARKVKCDEGKPTCKNCRKHAVDCSYALSIQGSQVSSAHARVVENTDFNTVSPTPMLGEQDASEPELAISDLELLHHFSTSTAYTFSKQQSLQTFWRVKAPQIGFSAPYALRAILSISALHLAYLRPNQRQIYVVKAEYHHNAALKQVAPEMAHLGPENSASVLLVSMLTSLISCAKPRKLDDLLLFEEGRISDWLVSFRGTGTIVHYANEAIRAGPLSTIFTIRGRRSAFRSSLSTEGQDFMEGLEHLIRAELGDDSHVSIYLEAIDEMKKPFALWLDSHAEVLETDDVFVWLLSVSNEFLALLKEQQPVALVIFGYFCVLVRKLEWMWWMEGWSMHLLSRIYSLLDEEHRTWIQWPMEQLGWCP